MKRTLVLLAVVFGAALVAWAQVPIRELDGAAATGGANSTPVDVMNFPIDEQGAIYVSTTSVFRVYDVLDATVTLTHPEWWFSPAFNLGQFSEVALQVTAVPEGGPVDCYLESSFADGEPFFGFGGGVRLSGGASEVTKRNGLIPTEGPLIRVRCRDDTNESEAGPEEPLLTDLKLLVRR